MRFDPLIVSLELFILDAASNVLDFGIVNEVVTERFFSSVFAFDEDASLAAQIPCLTDLVMVGVEVLNRFALLPFTNGLEREQA